MRFLLTALILDACLFGGEAAHDLAWSNDLDLSNFVTRPEIKVPRLNVTIYEPDKVTPGYWFIAPYTDINAKTRQPRMYHACQVGPSIYDEDGELVYTGACEWENQNACDFRAWNINGSYYLSTLLYQNAQDPRGRGIIMDNSYRVVHAVHPRTMDGGLNMHEFNLVENGRNAIYITSRVEYVNVTEVEDTGKGMGYIINIGFREIDIQSGETKFEWWAHPDVSLSESTTAVTAGIRNTGGWNWFHANAVEKNSEGDYLVSSRYTDTVYKVSGATGKILWRLGGINSDFELLGFNFSRQHDARWIQEECSAQREVVTLLDNAGDEFVKSANHSTAFKIELDLDLMTASIQQKWARPDQDRSLLRGNFQHLGENVFASWSDNSYFSEHTSDGRLVMEAEFASSRMVTYRAYKANFTGHPHELPVLKAFVYGSNAESSTTVSYVSWNGATEVDRWAFYNSTGDLIDIVKRQGFETRSMSRGAESQVYAEAIAADGSVLGVSDTYELDLPFEWSSSDLDSTATQQISMGSTNEIKTEL